MADVQYANASVIFPGILKELLNAFIITNEVSMVGMRNKTGAHRTNATSYVTISDYELIQMIFNHYDIGNPGPKPLEEMMIR